MKQDMRMRIGLEPMPIKLGPIRKTPEALRGIAPNVWLEAGRAESWKFESQSGWYLIVRYPGLLKLGGRLCALIIGSQCRQADRPAGVANPIPLLKVDRVENCAPPAPSRGRATKYSVATFIHRYQMP